MVLLGLNQTCCLVAVAVDCLIYNQSGANHVTWAVFLFRVALAASFPALGTGSILSRASLWLYVFHRLEFIR